MEYLKLGVFLALAGAIGCGGSHASSADNSPGDSSTSGSDAAGADAGGAGDDGTGIGPIIDASVAASDAIVFPMVDGGGAPDAIAFLPTNAPTRIFKSPGGSIMFQWPQAANATSYQVVIDGKTVATTQGNVPFALVPVTAIPGAFPDAGAAGASAVVHSWSINTMTGTGLTSGASTQFTLAEAVDGTTGVPLGGAGSGAIKFCPWNGQFAFQSLVPAGEHDYLAQPNTKFQLYTKRGANVVAVPKLTAAKANGRYDDDAIFPIEQATFPTTNDVTATLLAFAPYDRADQKTTTLPLAFYQFTLYNHETTPVDVAVAFQLDTLQPPGVVNGLGMAAGGNVQKALYATTTSAASVISVGSDTGFASNGVYSNTPVGNANAVAVKVTLPPGGQTDVKFVLSWYEADDPTGYYYDNLGTSAQEFAQTGLDGFDTLRQSALTYTERFRASNVPDWILNETMDFTTWTNNSIYTKDGRYSECEGHYVWFGQMDQGWHAFGSEISRIPEIAWGWNGASEMEFWARTMMVGSYDGQISHDFTPAAGQVTDHETCTWDAPGYHGWGGPDWSDLNCGFIFGVYEGFVQTGDKARMDFYWPYVKRTANRLYQQASKLSAAPGFPFTFNENGCTYDKGTQDHALYNSGLAITAFKVIADLAGIYGDTAMQTQFMTAYTTAIQSYRQRWLVNPTTSIGANQEAAVAGLWMGLHFKQAQPFTDTEIDAVMGHLFNDFWQPLTLGMAASTHQGENEGWIPYILGHLAGAAIETDNITQWRALQRDSYNRYFENRSRVFNGDIYAVYETLGNNYASTDFSGHAFYVSLPVVWHNYNAFIGFWHNAYSGELYVQPKLPSTSDQWGASMNHQLTNAFFVTPGSYGSLDYAESGAGFLNRDVVVRFDVPQNVSAIYLTDDFGAAPTATVNGTPVSFQRAGTGKYDRKLKLMWSGMVGPAGVHVVVTNG
jgi:uncharacterized protein (DUF608 family)